MKYTYTFVTPGYHELQLVEKSLLAISVSILHRVQSINQRRLVPSGVGVGGVGTSLAQGVGAGGSGVGASLPHGVGAGVSQDTSVTGGARRSGSTGASLLLVRG